VIPLQVVDRAFDGSPASSLISEFLGSGLHVIEFPIVTARLVPIDRVEVVRVEFGLARVSAEEAPRLVYDRSLDTLGYVGREFVLVRVAAPVTQRLQQSPIA